MEKNYHPFTGCNNIVVNPHEKLINQKLECLKTQDEKAKLFEAIARAGMPFSGVD